jgi:hypothetical protein
MADIKYTVSQDDPNSIQGFEQFSQADKNLIGTFEVNNLFDNTKNLAELHIYSLSDTLLESHYDYSRYKLLGNAQSAGKSGATTLTIDPIEDAKAYGYQYGGVKLLYHFLNDPYTLQKQKVPFYIDSISPDRTEVRLQSLELSTDDIKSFTTQIKDKLASQSYFNEFRLNFENNDLLIGINIDVVEDSGDSYVVVKLYDPLPSNFSVKSIAYINEVISDSVVFEVDSIIELPQPVQNNLRPANFNLDVADYSVIPTGYYTYNDLFSYPVNNTNSQIFSLVSEKGAELSIDHTDYSDFIHFSSAYERVANFKYKIQLLENYSSSLARITTQTSQSIGVTGSSAYFTGQIQGILDNFDHYERYLYYESSSNAWPKVNTTVPYINYHSTSSQALSWYANQLANANGYDLSNQNLLTNTIPSFISDDSDNQNYLTFVHMIGQHFDNLWIYAKAVSDKYDGDNRLDFGISKDLVGEALRNFGVKLYTSNKSTEDLFNSFIGQTYQTGSEVINTLVTGSITGSNIEVPPISYDNYNKEVHKRMYHNLSHLLKTKGTERGVRALINCFGIPSDILKIKTYGGRNVNEDPFFGDYQYYTSSLDKIRLDNTGSIVEGNTLSGNVSIVKRDKKYTDDLHNVEIGFSPSDNVDSVLISGISAYATRGGVFNIDEYIGDPRNLNSDSYDQLDSAGNRITDLTAITNAIMDQADRYDIFDYVRLIKFFDNTVFKTVRDFLPARVVADTGIIIKPHLLSRSKAKSVTTTATEAENLLTASIDTAFIEGSHGSTFGSLQQYLTRYVETVQTPFGLGTINQHNQEEAKYDGEFSGSGILVTNGELTEDNTYLIEQFSQYNDNIYYVTSSVAGCILFPVNISTRFVNSTEPYNIGNFFTGIASNVEYTLIPTNPSGTPYTITSPFTFSSNNFNQYDEFTITAENPNFEPICQANVDFVYGVCNISTRSNQPDPLLIQIQPGNPQSDPINLINYFEIGTENNQDNLQFTLTKNEEPNPLATLTFTQASAYIFQASDFDLSDTVTVVLRDTKLGQNSIDCSTEVVLTITNCILNKIDINSSAGTVGFYSYESFSSIISAGVVKSLFDEDTPLDSPYEVTKNPILRTNYELWSTEEEVYNPSEKFPFLQNPNTVFEQAPGVPRQSPPNFSMDATGLTPSNLGLHSFFTGLGNLNELHYEVYYADRVQSSTEIDDVFLTPLGTPSPETSVNYQWYPIAMGPYGGPSYNYDSENNQYPPMIPGQIGPSVYNPDTETDDLTLWTYTDEVESSDPTLGMLTGRVPKVNIQALRNFSIYGFGEYTVRPLSTSDQIDYWRYPLKIIAYVPADTPEKYVCAAVLDIVYEAWIEEVVQPGTGGGNQ